MNCDVLWSSNEQVKKWDDMGIGKCGDWRIAITAYYFLIVEASNVIQGSRAAGKDG